MNYLQLLMNFIINFFCLFVSALALFLAFLIRQGFFNLFILFLKRSGFLFLLGLQIPMDSTALSSQAT